MKLKISITTKPIELLISVMVLGYFIFGFRYKTLDRLDYRDTSLITVYLIVIEISNPKNSDESDNFNTQKC